MTEEKLVERVTALFADSDAAQRKMIRLYAETNDAIEASAIIDSGAEVLHMLQGGLRPEVLVLDSVLSDTTIFPPQETLDNCTVYKQFDESTISLDSYLWKKLKSE